MDAAVLARLDRLEAIAAIQSLIGRYAQAADRGNDPAIMRGLFADNGIWEARGFGRCEGAERIAGHLAAIAAREIRWSLHLMGTPWIEIETGAETATAGWQLWELARMADGSPAPPQAHWIGGGYEAQLVRTPAGWRFQHVVLNLALVSRYAEGWRLIGEVAAGNDNNNDNENEETAVR